MAFQSNPQLELAFDYVRNTNKNIFLTGKAGTGKTTFLHQLKTEGHKRMVIVAPTGVAAINAGGMTIHSFFQLPFGLHLPGASRNDESRQRRFSGQKISLMRSLDLLVIDEISMVRADLLDAIDEVLRRYRDHARPFGGVQLLMIGDLHQLPPVVKQDEWDLLRQHYDTPYFFGSLELRKTDPVSIELKHIYRQSDEHFIHLLNKVRDNQMDNEVMETLNSRYIPNFAPKEEDAYITLTATNAVAHDINATRLAALPGTVHLFKAKIENDFPQFSYPTDETLEFKIGSQVMFVKNDIQPEKRFYNGKIGQVTQFADGEIHVRCPNEPSDIIVTPVEWQNVKYSLNEKTKEVDEELLGTFTQYPLKLAWAITIHKSQGLTFERAIIDAQAAFAHGQVYVALSRCKSFEGIVLRTKIGWSAVKTDSVVKNYTEEAERNAPNEAQLQQAKREYQQSLVAELFSFKTAKRYFDQLHRTYREHENTLGTAALHQLQALTDKARGEVFEMAEKFGPSLAQYFAQQAMPEANEALQERLRKAGGYFVEKIGELLPEAKAIPTLTDNKAVKKQAIEQLEALQKEFFIKNACFAKCVDGFSATTYVRTKADSELDFAKQKSTTTASPSSSAPRDMPHPALFNLLMRWRDETAADHGVEGWGVLPTSAVRELVTYLPTDAANLRRIKGIGEVKVKMFGAAIVDIIEKYCTEKHIAVNLLASAGPPPPPKPPKVDTKRVSFDMLKAGKTIDQIALERGLVRGTIEGHLTQFISAGELDIYEVLPKEQVEEISAFFIEHQSTGTQPAKEHFGEKYDYGVLRMVLTSLKRNGDVASGGGDLPI